MERTEPRTGIPAAEFRERRERLLEHVRQSGLAGYVLFGADYIQYFTGFWFLSNERPVIYAESVDGESGADAAQVSRFAGHSKVSTTLDLYVGEFENRRVNDSGTRLAAIYAAAQEGFA